MTITTARTQGFYQIPNSVEAFAGRTWDHEVVIGSSFVSDTHITRDGWPIQAIYSMFTKCWTVLVDVGEDDELITLKGWRFDQLDMVATCPHNEQTEIDGDTVCCKSVLHELGL